MKKRFLLQIFGIGLFCLLFTGYSNAQTVTIDYNTANQTIRGFGGISMPGWKRGLTTEQATLAFGNGDGQLGLSILRVRVPTKSMYFPIEVPAAVVAKNLGAIIFASPWSPPIEMKSNKDSIGGSLNTTSYGAYADYLLSYATYMKNNGAPLYAISLQNEPDISVSYSSCNWTSAQMVDFLKNQGSKFDDLKVIAPECFQFNKSFSDAILNDANAVNQVDIVGGHIYGAGLADYPLARTKGKEVWMTEHYTESKNSGNLWPMALDVGTEIHNCMAANFNAYIWWYICRYYGFIGDGEMGTTVSVPTKRGYLMAQYSKFVRPGNIRLTATEKPLANVKVTAYKSDTSVVVVVVNTNTTAQTLTFNLSNVEISSLKKITTSGSKSLFNEGTVTFSANSFSSSVDAQSVTTFIAKRRQPYFRSKSTGNWNNTATWESSPDNTTWYNASEMPTSSTISINILNSHEVTVAANATAPLLTVKPGGKLTLNSGNTLAANTFILESDATNGTGTFVDKNVNGGLTVSGSSQVNQYLTYRTWYLTPPVVSATPTGMSKVKYYKEADNSWPEITTTPTMTAGKGYLVIPVSGNSIKFTGSLNNGNQSIPLTRSAGNTVSPGFNLVGNPYPSYLDWTALCNYSTDAGVTKPNTAILSTTTMWYRTKVGSAYTFYTVNGAGEVSPAAASKNIPPMQAFWVRTKTGGGNLALTNAMCSHAPTSNFLLKAPAAKNGGNERVRLQVSNGSNTDEAVIYVSENAFNDFDSYDSPKMSNDNTAIPEIYTTLDNQQIVINAMNSLPLDTEIGLGFVPGDSTSFTLKANEITNLPSDVKVILKDNANNGKETDLTDGVTAYQFSPATTTGDRFSIIFRSTGTLTPVDENTDNGIVVYSTQKSIHVTVNSGLDEKATVRVFNSLGQQLANQPLTSRNTIVDGNFRDGVYVVKVTNGGILATTQKIVIQ